MTNATLTLHPIGVIRTPFLDRAEAPRQPGAESNASEGTIVLNSGQNYEQALEDLDGFELIWIVSWFHKNKNWKPKVRPPRGSAVKRGVFATRSPHRPNPIGLSVARLIDVSGRTIRVAETDLLDGTPILDIKPYIPAVDAHPIARAGWLEGRGRSEVTLFEVTWSSLAKAQSAWLRDACGIDLIKPTERTLSRNAVPHPYRRISLNESGALQLAVKSWRLEFSVHEKSLEIQSVRSGYAASALNSGKPLHDHAAHEAFHARWP